MAAKSVLVECVDNGRQVSIKTTPTMSLKSILDQACSQLTLEGPGDQFSLRCVGFF
jgi:hypothetical protein